MSTPGDRVGRSPRHASADRLGRPPIRRLRRDRRGETIIEFAIVAPLLLLLLLIIVDLGLMLFTQSLLDGAARDAARMIRTGQVQNASVPITTFQNKLCAGMSPIMTAATCQSQVVFEVQTFAQFTNVSFNPCVRNQNDPNGSGTQCTFDPGTLSTIIGVQVTYNRPFIVPWVGGCLTGGACWFGVAGQTGNTGSGHSVPLVSTVVFKTEPFPS